MKARYFISIVLLILLVFIANCTKKTDEPPIVNNPDPVKEDMLIKKYTVATEDSVVFNTTEYTYYSDNRIKQIKRYSGDQIIDFTYSGDTLFSQQYNSSGINELNVESYRMNDSMVYDKSIFIDYGPNSYDTTLIRMYIYYVGECGYRKSIDENGQSYDNEVIYTDENCSWSWIWYDNNHVCTIDDKNNYRTSVVENLYTNYNVGNVISYSTNSGISTDVYIYNDNDYPVSSISYSEQYGTTRIQTYEYY